MIIRMPRPPEHVRTECSILCEADRGIHRVLSASTYLGLPNTLESVRAVRIGKIETGSGSTCVPVGAKFRVISIDYAECPPMEGYALTYLLTVELVD